MNASSKKSYGSIPQTRARNLLGAILLIVMNNDRDSGLEFNEDWDERVTIKTTLKNLVLLVHPTLKTNTNEFKQAKMQVRDALGDLRDFVGILDDYRTQKKGSDQWHFSLKLWGREVDRNLAEFDKLWESKRSPQSKAVTAQQQVSRSLPDAPKGYVWVAAQLERARLQISKGQIPLDFFDGSEATWLDMVAGHDVVRDVQPEILETIQQWCDRGDRMSMALIQGRSGDGKSTALRRVVTDLVGQDYAVLWYRGQGSLNREALEILSADQDLFVCVDDLTKILPEEIEQTLRDLQAVSARIFWIVSVRDDLWGGMNLALRQVVKLFEFPVRRLSDREISGLLDRLATYDALGRLTGLGREAQEARLKESANRQLLVALLEAKYNESLREYVLRNLYELEQRFGKVVADACKLTCAVQRFGFELPIEYLQEILGVSSPHGDIFSKTEGFLYPPSSITGHDGVHVRHGVIATTVFEADSAAYEWLGQFIRVDLHLKSRWEKWTPSLCHAIRLSMRTHQLDLDQVRQVFQAASEDVDIRKYVLNIWAILEKQVGNIDKARSLFEKGTQADPKHAPVWQAWALMERDQGNIDKARSLFEKGTQADPKHAPSWQAWALMERDQGNIDKARSLFEKGTQADPKDAPSWQAWALMERDQGNIDKARSLFEKGTQADPKNAPSWQAWALMERDQGNIDKARSLFEKGTQADPKDAPSWQAWALMERDQGNIDKARSLFKRATDENPNEIICRSSWLSFEQQQNQPEYLRDFHHHMTVLFPHDVKSWQAWATFERTQGESKRAREFYKKATQVNPQNIPSWQAWAIMEKELGNYAAAQDLFRKASEVDSSRQEIWQAWALMEKELDHPAEARLLFQSAIEADPTSAPAWQAWSLLELEQGNPDEALTLAKKAVQCQPKGMYPRLARGQIYQALGEPERAFQDLNYVCEKLERALNHKPNNNRDLNLLARALTFLGDYTKAQDTLKRSLQVSSLQQKPYAHNGLGELYAAQGNREAAIEEWEKALELSPYYLPAKNNLKRIKA